jgi:phosphoribosyl 1,2-cyclic phosphodiesterase
MDIKIIASGSSGNCYKISDGKTALLIECGIPIKKIKEGCDFDFSNIAGCIISHEHGDHAKAVRDVMKMGIEVWTSRGTAEAIGLNVLDYNSHVFNALAIDGKGLIEYASVGIGTFWVAPFTVHHDAAEPVGFLIHSKITGDRLLFMTDSYYTDYRFSGLTHIMIEANYSKQDLNDAVEDGRTQQGLKKRLYNSHMSLEHCIEMLKANDLSKVKQIYLLHLSGNNSDGAEFKKRVQEQTGCEVYIA